jgi:hypothetical protein
MIVYGKVYIFLRLLERLQKYIKIQIIINLLKHNKHY